MALETDTSDSVELFLYLRAAAPAADPDSQVRLFLHWLATRH